jgi:hypothetical protein
MARALVERSPATIGEPRAPDVDMADTGIGDVVPAGVPGVAGFDPPPEQPSVTRRAEPASHQVRVRMDSSCIAEKVRGRRIHRRSSIPESNVFHCAMLSVGFAAADMSEQAVTHSRRMTGV